MTSAPRVPSLCVDTHAHLHPEFDLDRALDQAAFHARRAARDDCTVRPDGAVLCLADPESGRRFSSLRRRGQQTLHIWELHPTQERESVLARRPDAATVALIAGQQIQTCQGIEVLGIGTVSDVPSGLPVKETADLVREAGAIVVLPWGFGKWLLRRKRIVEGLLESPWHRKLQLADSGARPSGTPEPALFQRAKAAGIPVLAGSDPYPLSGHERRVGQYGVLVPDFPLDERPAQRLRHHLSKRDQLRFFGQRDSLWSALLGQIRLGLR